MAKPPSTAVKDPYGPSNDGHSFSLNKCFAIILLLFGGLSMFATVHHHTVSNNYDSKSYLETLHKESWSVSSSATSQQNLEEKKSQFHKLAGLNCDDHGGPSNDIAKEMVFWENIPSDEKYVSPFKKEGRTQYLTFEPDRGGWNNIRMSM